MTLQAIVHHLPVVQLGAKLFPLWCAEQCGHGERRFWSSALACVW
ncbi:hypothetical protein SynNOUM97013_02115 [Synechococcus sp. NOUM97013]|nr:hypothetical protein SynNOUM97013_02115 [Synechococcus sp. NOUM97013]